MKIEIEIDNLEDLPVRLIQKANSIIVDGTVFKSRTPHMEAKKKVILEAGYLFTQDITVPHKNNTLKGYLILWSNNTVTFEVV
jgi:hypothetical protein